MTNDERMCPVCDKPVDPKKGVYRVGETDYHRECYVKRQAIERREAAERRAAADRRASEGHGGSGCGAAPETMQA